MKTVAIVPAAGSGKRLRSKVKKPFVLLKGRELVTYALRALDNSPVIDAIMIASEKRCLGRFKKLVKRQRLKKVMGIVAGGKTRLESVRNCLAAAGGSFDIVLIHDGARPLVDQDTIRKAVKLAAKYGACVTALPESDTVKVVGKDMSVKTTMDRSVIYRAQTPQAFRLDIITKAYNSKSNLGATDDSALVEGMGKRVKVLEGSCRNIKVTTREDLKLAEVLL